MSIGLGGAVPLVVATVARKQAIDLVNSFRLQVVNTCLDCTFRACYASL
jgi:hypothetical protein